RVRGHRVGDDGDFGIDPLRRDLNGDVAIGDDAHEAVVLYNGNRAYVLIAHHPGDLIDGIRRSGRGRARRHDLFQLHRILLRVAARRHLLWPGRAMAGRGYPEWEEAKPWGGSKVVRWWGGEGVPKHHPTTSPPHYLIPLSPLPGARRGVGRFRR